MEGYLVRLARRARGEPLGFAPTNTSPPPFQPIITDEPPADVPPAEQSLVTIDYPGASMPLRRERPEPRIERDTAPSLATRVLAKRLAPTAALAAPLRPPLEVGGVRVAASISPEPSPSVGSAPVAPTLMPGAPAASEPVDVSEIASEIVEEPAGPFDPTRSAGTDIERTAFKAVPAAARRLEPDMAAVAVSPDAPTTPFAVTGRSRSRPRGAFAESAGDEPVRVTIGRIEVRAPASAPPVLPDAEPAMVPRLSLAEYLQQRDREGGR